MSKGPLNPYSDETGFIYECYVCELEQSGSTSPAKLPKRWRVVKVSWPEDKFVGYVYKFVCSGKCEEELKTQDLIEG